MNSKIKCSMEFLRHFCRSPGTIGAILPSSKYLADAISRYIKKDVESNRKRYYLEVGPGTGGLTEKIIQLIKEKDRLDLVEFNQTFCEILRQKFGRQKNVHIYHSSILNWKNEGVKYDVIVSGLPLNSFSVHEVEEILKRYKEEFIIEGGYLSYFEYPMITDIRKIFLGKERNLECQEVKEIKSKFYKKFGIFSEIVWLNAPPARVRHCQIKGVVS